MEIKRALLREIFLELDHANDVLAHDKGRACVLRKLRDKLMEPHNE